MNDGNVPVTRDSGATWTPIIAGLPQRAITEIIVDEADPAIAYLTNVGLRHAARVAHDERRRDVDEHQRRFAEHSGERARAHSAQQGPLHRHRPRHVPLGERRGRTGCRSSRVSRTWRCSV